MTATRLDRVVRYRSALTRTGRVASAVKLAMGFAAWAIFILPNDRNVDPFRMATEAALYGIALVVVEAVVEPFRRRGIFEYTAALADRDRGGLSLDIRDTALTRRGRGLGAGFLVAIATLVLATVTGVLGPGALVSAAVLGLILLGIFIYDADTPVLGGLTRKDFIQFDASPNGLLWVRNAHASDEIPWTGVRRITRRIGLSGTSVTVEWQPPVARPRYPTEFVERMSGETVDLAMVALAIRPRAWRQRRRLTFRRIEWVLEPVGTVGP